MVLRFSCLNWRQYASSHASQGLLHQRFFIHSEHLLIAPLLATTREGQQSWRASTPFCAAAGICAGLGLIAVQPGQPVRCDNEARLYPKDLERLLTPTPENPTPVEVPPPFPGLMRQAFARPQVFPVFGLPMRGKTYIARQLKHYIEYFHGARAEVFDISQYIKENGDEELLADLESFFGKESFDPYAFGQERKPLSAGGFAILLSRDAVESTNSKWSAHNKYHRRWMARKLKDELHAAVCFIQITVEGPQGEQYLADLAAFRGKNCKELQALINDYQDHYVPLQMDGSENGSPFIHLINYKQSMVVNKMVQSTVGSKICHFLSNLHPYQHTTYLSRHGESQFNVEKKLGGDSGLSRRGEEYARRLAEFAKYVVCGKATDLVCVTLTPQDFEKLQLMLSGGMACGLMASGDWSGYGDSSGGVVKEGMHLKRLQLDYGSDFADAPTSMEDLLRRIKTSTTVTLVFVAGDTSNVGQVFSHLWTSSLRRTIDTAKFIEHPMVPGPSGNPVVQMRGQQYRNIDEVYAGECDGLTEEDIAERFPDIAAARKRDKLGFRYPRGESYYDILARLETVMASLEKIEQPLLLISHQAVLRMIYGWLTYKTREEAIKTKVPQHEVIKISYDGLGGPVSELRYPLGPTRLIDDGQHDF